MKNQLNHRKLWFDSMVGMTYGFIGSLILGTIIGLFGLWSNDNIFVSIKKGMAFITPFAIGIGIGVKTKKGIVETMAIGLGAFIAGHSMLVPYYRDGIVLTDVHLNISLKMLPGDVFASWLASVLVLYFFGMYNKKTMLDIYLVPLLGVLIGIIFAFSGTYLTSLVTVCLEWVVEKTINHHFYLAIILAPVLGIIMGFALTMPTSSAAMAFALSLHGDASVAAIAATSAQMVSFGVMTYVFTGSIQKSFAVGIGTSMLQLKNIIKKPTIILIPLFASAMGAMIAIGTFHNELPFFDVTKAPHGSVTSGMGTAGLYGQIFTLKENGWDNHMAWINVICVQLLLPITLTIPLAIWAKKKNIIKNGDMDI